MIRDNCILGDMAMLNLDFQIGQRFISCS